MNLKWISKKMVMGTSLFIIVGLLISMTVWYQITEPLVNNGLQQVNNEDGQTHEYVLELSNEGYVKIDILSVKINGEDQSDLAQLGIAYDSGRMVQVLPTHDPDLQFMDLKASSIYPALSQDEFKAALAKKEHTPMQYGLRLRYDNQSIQNVTIKYKYFGFTKEKNITKWFNPDLLY